MNRESIKERRTAWAILIIAPLSMMAMLAYVTMGHAPGLGAGHPMIYLQLTCILWALIMTVVPILRILRLVSLPLWFILVLYADMYMYVISLCMGMYMDYYWWANFTHVISSIVVASIVFLALCKMAERSPPHVSLGSKGGIIMLTVMIGAGFGALWELMEGATDLLGGYEFMIYGAIDALGNVAADLIGVFLMSVILMFILRKHEVIDIASKVRIGKKNIDTD